ncbi:MAG: PIN domain-containing protein [Euryarchaeota archaeon]|nr:PIN domain-containing protein [Euryarchaeota archaeon]
MDANVLIAALMRDSMTRRILVLGGHELHVAEYVFEEIEGHWEELSSRSGLAPDAFRAVLTLLRAHVAEHKVAEYGELLAAAIRLLKDRDADDAPYVALALAIHADALWTEDRELSSLDAVRVARTKDLVPPAP